MTNYLYKLKTSLLKYKIIIIMLSNLIMSKFYSNRRHLDHLFLNAFKNKITCSSILDTVSILMSSTVIRYYSVLVVNRNVKVSPPTRCVCAGNAFARSCTFLRRIKLPLLIFYNLELYYFAYLTVSLILSLDILYNLYIIIFFFYHCLCVCQ
jgi:hypothetical protein